MYAEERRQAGCAECGLPAKGGHHGQAAMQLKDRGEQEEWDGGSVCVREIDEAGRILRRRGQENPLSAPPSLHNRLLQSMAAALVNDAAEGEGERKKAEQVHTRKVRRTERAV